MNPKTNNAFPKFYGSSADSFEIFSSLELAGDDRCTHIDENLYLYSGPAYTSKDNNCYRFHEILDEYKARIKIPLQKLKSIDDKAYTDPSSIIIN